MSSESASAPEVVEINEGEALDYIKSVELAPLSEEQASALTAALSVAGREAFVNRGSIQYLPLPEQQKTDSLYWTLFAQLAADARVNREKDPDAWHKEYVRVLGQVGMRASGWTRNSANGSQAGTTVDATVLRYLKPYLSPAAQRELDKIIQGLRKEVNKKPLSLFNTSSSDTSSANFQVSDGTVDRYLNLTIHVGFLDFKTHQTITNLLFWHYANQDFKFYYSKDTMTLAKNLADRLRRQLYDRVASHVAGNINDIDLG
jgi:hypothetical protein